MRGAGRRSRRAGVARAPPVAALRAGSRQGRRRWRRHSRRAFDISGAYTRSTVGAVGREQPRRRTRTGAPPHGANSMTELRQLRYFVTVAEEGQMTRAAAKLHLAQPALSQAVSQLEARLGVELFERHARGVTLTAAGEAYLTKAGVVLAALADAELTAQAAARAASRTVEWGFTASPPMVEAPQLFGAFTASCPDASVSFRELSFPRESTATWLSQVDVALCYSPTPHPDVDPQPLRDEPRVALVASRHPLARRRELAVADVLDETFCGTDPTLEPVRGGFWRLDYHRGGAVPQARET